ncbi:hypothetical protein D3C74_370000 [compost metagenome]
MNFADAALFAYVTSLLPCGPFGMGTTPTAKVRSPNCHSAAVNRATSPSLKVLLSSQLVLSPVLTFTTFSTLYRRLTNSVASIVFGSDNPSLLLASSTMVPPFAAVKWRTTSRAQPENPYTSVLPSLLVSLVACLASSMNLSQSHSPWLYNSCGSGNDSFLNKSRL